MNTKTLLGGILTAVIAFLLGWLIFGILLMDYYSANMTTYSGLLKNPTEMWAIAVANLAWGLLLAYIFNLGGVKSPAKGFTAAFVINLLMILGFDLMMEAQYNLYSEKLLVIDVIVNAVFGGILGAFLGWWMGRGTKTA